MTPPMKVRFRRDRERDWNARFDAMAAKIDELARALESERARVKRLEEALRFQDPRNAAERYEVIARDFNRETGFFAPGKSMPAAMGAYTEEEEKKRQALWRSFVNRWHEEWFDAALKDTEGTQP